VDNKADLDAALSEFFGSTGPKLLDIKVSESAKMTLSLEKFD